MTVSLMIIALAVFTGRTHAAAADTTGYSAAALYNAANAYARAGTPGLAVLNYERAALLAPEDPDIAANLRHVRQDAHLDTGSENRFERAATAVNPLMASWLGVAGVLLAGAGLLASRLAPRHRGKTRGAALAGLLLVGITLSQAAVLWPKVHAGVILTAAAPARVTPAPMGDPLFVLPEAETVQVTAEHEDFVLIRTRTGQRGWVSRANLAPVVPRSCDYQLLTACPAAR